MRRRSILVLVVLAGLAVVLSQWRQDELSAYEDWPDDGPACEREESIQRGQSSYAFNHAGELREFEIYVPSSYTPGDPMPLVTSFHGLGGSSKGHLIATGWPAVAESEEFIVVAPQGIGDLPGWDYATPPQTEGSDLGFAEEVNDRVDRLACIDSDGRYVSGFSNGSLMAMAIVCKTEIEIDAVGSMGAIGSPEDCTNDRVVPWIYLHALDDATVPYLGGATPVGPLGSVEENLALWADRSGCEEAEAMQPEEETAPYAASFTWAGCDTGVPALAYIFDGLGHTWPQPEVGFGADAGRMMWAFFASAPVPG